MTLFPMSGYARFYRSLLRFCRGVDEGQAAELTHKLYTANLESCRNYHPDTVLPEISKAEFHSNLNNSQEKPYREIIQLYRAMEALLLNTNTSVITVEQTMAKMKLCNLMDSVETRFRKAFYMAINDKRTVYNLCKQSLVNDENEPGLCLIQDLP